MTTSPEEECYDIEHEVPRKEFDGKSFRQQLAFEDEAMNSYNHPTDNNKEDIIRNTPEV